MIPSYSISFLINPVSGGGLGATVYKYLPEIMASFGYQPKEWTAILTDKDKMEEQSLHLLETSQKVIAVGGDGTVGLILSQLSQKNFPAQIGLIPLGTGNDLGRILGIYKIFKQRGLIACIKRLIRSQSTVFDLWNINQTHTLAAYFSLGLDAAVLHDFDVARKNNKIPKGVLFNQLYYAMAFFKRKKFQIKEDIRLSLKSKEQTTEVKLKGATCCIIGNINSYAGGAKIFPESHFDDGKLDVLVFRSFWQLFFVGIGGRLAPSLFKKYTRKLELYQTEQISITPIQQAYCQLDGEDMKDLFPNQELKLSLSQKIKLLDLRKSPFDFF